MGDVLIRQFNDCGNLLESVDIIEIYKTNPSLDSAIYTFKNQLLLTKRMWWFIVPTEATHETLD